jgi:hypothetical protein
MPEQHQFEHLPLLLRFQGPARLRGGGEDSPQTRANKLARQAHSQSLGKAAQSLTTTWKEQRAERQAQDLPVIPNGIPILLQVDPGLDLDVLRDKFAFEIVAEQEEGYVIVASEDIEMTLFLEMLQGFSVAVHGSATIAKVHRLFDDPTQADRLARILSERLLAEWPTIADDQDYIVDLGIACTGSVEIPPQPKRGKRLTDAEWAAKEQEWSQGRLAAYNAWDEIKIQREDEITNFAAAYGAEIMHMIDGDESNEAVLPDSFTVRLKIVFKGLKDFVLNYAYLFEVVEPEEIALPQFDYGLGLAAGVTATPQPPDEDAPTVCVIDSGIQEGHLLLQPAIDTAASHCFLPGVPSTDVADHVAPGGHGTRVAGAVLYGESVPVEGNPQLPFLIQNARVLDAHNCMPVELFPPEVLRAVVQKYHLGPKQTRIFNHSINARGYCRTRYMSAWAAEIDHLCMEYDVLIVQSVGNLPLSGTAPILGIRDHLAAGRDYPQYLYENASRIANPGQSLQALTVGSIAYGAATNGAWSTFAEVQGAPSAFSRAGPGIWNVIKPEVVEFGGDAVKTGNQYPDVQCGGVLASACPELVRSTTFPPGPAADRDDTGTSFAAPKVAGIAAQIQRMLPDEPTLLYRALVVQSARWPEWAESMLMRLRRPDPLMSEADKQELRAAAFQALRSIGYGLPDAGRATTNTDFRTTLITSGEAQIKAGECHVYQVPIPAALRQQADDFDIRIDVTMSYVAQPRRTRRNLRRYLSTWVDWKASNLGEGLDDFRVRAVKTAQANEEQLPGETLPWTLHEKRTAGVIRDVRRNSGTVQKDWAIVRSNTLPDHFCIAVVGHQGWSRDPDSAARYVLVVTFEILGQEINIYEPLRIAVQELQAEIENMEVEAEVEIEE